MFFTCLIKLKLSFEGGVRPTCPIPQRERSNRLFALLRLFEVLRERCGHFGDEHLGPNDELWDQNRLKRFLGIKSGNENGIL